MARIDRLVGEGRRYLFLWGQIFLTVLIWAAPGKPTSAINFSVEFASSLYVDGPKASDSNSGTSSRPRKSISKPAKVALQNYSKGVATLAVIFPGIYRERFGIGLS
jgi:hypothetical protein